jgi:hypothetical protein
MEPADAAMKVLDEAGEEDLHWTVVWDRALRAGYVNPMEQPDARNEFVGALAEAARAGRIVKTSKGTYRRA